MAGLRWELANSSGRVDGWLEEMWSWMLQFKDRVQDIMMEPGSIATKLLALKFLETCVIYFTPQANDEELTLTEAIAKNRVLHYDRILSSLLGFDPYVETERAHSASIRYSVRTAFLGFLRCSHPYIVESRDKLLRALRALYPGEATEQLIRQVEKMSRSAERGSRDIRRTALNSSDISTTFNESPAKKARFDLQDEDDLITDNSSNGNLMNSTLTPAEKMIAMIGALIAEGERGAQSLELLVNNIHADLLADIVIETMKHLPESPFSLSAIKQENLPPTDPYMSFGVQSDIVSTAAESNGISMSTSHVPVLSSTADVKRDPRRDPRRLDPRRVVVPADLSSGAQNVESSSVMQPGPYYSSNNKSSSFPETIKVENTPEPLPSKNDMDSFENSADRAVGQLVSKENLQLSDEAREVKPSVEIDTPPIVVLPSVVKDEHEPAVSASSDFTVNDQVDNYMLESDYSSQTTRTSTIEDNSSRNLPMLPPYVDLSEEERRSLHQLVVKRIIDEFERNLVNARLPLLARLVSQNDGDDDIFELLQKHIILDYNRHKGHELAMHVLYHLQTVSIADFGGHSSSSVVSLYEKFLLSLAKALVDSFPASDKSFNRLLGEAPFLPDSVLKLLEDLCVNMHSREHHAKDSDGDRITQGLGAVWSLILGRPLSRQACLNIALKVANKLYPLHYASEHIEQFATNMLLSVVDQRVSETDDTSVSSREPKTEAGGSQETSISSSQNSEPIPFESDSMKSSLVSPSVSLSQAQCQTSLFFALCSKCIHRHIPILVRSLGASNTELLNIISDLPDGGENLIILTLETLTEDSTPSKDLIATVKHLYETKLKVDAAILIPLLSSLSKEEVLPIFPRLVDLPLDKFQAALARILQGSAHTGPALTPAEVLIAIHDINPEKDRVALKKITDVCTACFEQRTVFTQQVLASSLNQLVEKVPLPLLFMRTVIQAVDAFPTLVDFVMGILSKLVSKQIWRMPKLWVGFLKCAYQTQPHSFNALLQLPSPQLENALIKYPNLRVPLASHVSQQNMRNTLPRQTLKLLGLTNDPQ
ncbi:Symplekin [Ananas comosus]|uniref:Symplekin n=1 Tax=Ananas comosus TaxID=4615 RepID=A0A199VD57_ANACO|nr:Symplekin [Ananas comosus]